MQKTVIVAAILLVLTPARWCSAGIYRVYAPQEAIEMPVGGTPLPFRLFRDVTSKFLQIGNDQLARNQAREAYLRDVQTLQTKVRTGTITTDERIALSEHFLRLQRFDEAADILTGAAAQERGNFMVFANLASAHQQAGRLDRAINYLQQAKDVWPAESKSFTPEQLRWFALVEKYHLRLLRLRYAESIRGGQRAKTPESLDNLFGDDRGPIRFVGESGSYEPGKIDPREQARLPQHALAIVQQLVIWFPEDTRLLWLLAELYNAQGDITAAYTLMDDCVRRRYTYTELRQHRQILQEAKEAQSVTEASNAEATSPESAWLPDKRQVILVGGIAGLVVFALVYLQFREVRKRRTTKNH